MSPATCGRGARGRGYSDSCPARLHAGGEETGLPLIFRAPAPPAATRLSPVAALRRAQQASLGIDRGHEPAPSPKRRQRGSPAGRAPAPRAAVRSHAPLTSARVKPSERLACRASHTRLHPRFRSQLQPVYFHTPVSHRPAPLALSAGKQEPAESGKGPGFLSRLCSKQALGFRARELASGACGQRRASQLGTRSSGGRRLPLGPLRRMCTRCGAKPRCDPACSSETSSLLATAFLQLLQDWECKTRALGSETIPFISPAHRHGEAFESPRPWRKRGLKHLGQGWRRARAPGSRSRSGRRLPHLPLPAAPSGAPAVSSSHVPRPALPHTVPDEVQPSFPCHAEGHSRDLEFCWGSLSLDLLSKSASSCPRGPAGGWQQAPRGASVPGPGQEPPEPRAGAEVRRAAGCGAPACAAGPAGSSARDGQGGGRAGPPRTLCNATRRGRRRRLQVAPARPPPAGAAMETAAQRGSSPQAAAGAGDTVTQEVCHEGDVRDGELREVEVAGFPALLVRSGTRLWALGSRCPHAGAPLCQGVLKGDRLRCPWHGACFDIKTGDIEEYPTLDCLPSFQVKVEDGKVFITARKKDLESSRWLKDMSKRCRLNQTTALLLGGGPASLVCAETLRQEGFTGRIILVTKERHVPYDRTRLSKDMGVRAERIYLRAPEFFTAHDIEVWTEKEAVSIDTKGQKAQFKDGSSQRYDQLLIATGSRPKPLKCPGADLHNVRFLQTIEDANQILELATGKRLVIVGASFIGMEVASFLSDKASTISVVEREAVPFQEALGPQVGQVAMKMLQGRGVKFYMKSQVWELRGEDGKVTEAILDSGKKLPADVVVVGIGVSPASEFLKGSPVALDARGAVLVDLLMKTNILNVFAAGDVVAFPVALLGGERTSIYHWQVAQAHGHVAALNMLKKQSPLHTVPFFWTVLLGTSIRYAGSGKGFTETVVKGSLEKQKFVIFYIKDGYVTAAASLKCDPMVAMVAEALYAGKIISKEEAECSWAAWLERSQPESATAERGS